MGAKTWMLVYANAKVGEALRRSPQLDLDATLQLATSLFSKDKLEPIGEGDLSYTCPPDDELHIGCFPDVSVLAAKEFGIDYPSKLPVGATLSDADHARLKTEVMTDQVRRVNPTAKILQSPTRWQGAAELLRDRDVIFGCVDSFSERQQLEATARRYLLPYIDVGMDVHRIGEQFSISGQIVLSMPGQLCLTCFGILNENRLHQEAALYAAAGDHPQVVWADGVLASAAVGIFVQHLCPWSSISLQSLLREFDGESHTLALSNKMAYLANTKCTHFSDSSALGDPFFESGQVLSPFPD